MRRSSLFVAAVALAASVSGCRGWESEQPPVHLVRNMDTQRKGKAYRADPSGLFEDGRVMRPPVEGTVAVGSIYEDTFETGLDEEGQPTLKYPADFKPDETVRTRGAGRYQVYCSPCHGTALDGKGPVAGRGLVVPPPSLYDARIKSMPVGKIFAAISNGVNNGNMPSYAAQMPLEDRWATVAYVRQMQMKADPSVAEEGGQNLVVAKATEASVEHGKVLYEAKACITCHTLDGTKKVGPSFKGLFGKTESTDKGEVTVDEVYLAESITNPMAKVVTGFPPAMPPMPLDEIELKSLVLFIQAQK